MPRFHFPHRAGAKRFGFASAVVAGGVAASVLLSLSATGTLAGFTAAITNSTNSAGAGTLVMQEQNAGATITCSSTDATTVSVNSSTCSTINKYGASTTMVPGSTVSTTVTIKNVGTANAGTFTLTPGSCSQATNQSSAGSATDLCSRMSVAITSGSSTLFSGTLASLAARTSPIALTAPAAGISTTVTFAVSLDSTAGNTYQGLTASQPLTWTFGS